MPCSNISINYKLSDIKLMFNSQYWFIECQCTFDDKINNYILNKMFINGILDEVKKKFTEYVRENYKKIENIKYDIQYNNVYKCVNLKYGSCMPEFASIGIKLRFYQTDLSYEEIINTINDLNTIDDNIVYPAFAHFIEYNYGKK